MVGRGRERRDERRPHRTSATETAARRRLPDVGLGGRGAPEAVGSREVSPSEVLQDEGLRGRRGRRGRRAGREGQLEGRDAGRSFGAGGRARLKRNLLVEQLGLQDGPEQLLLELRVAAQPDVLEAARALALLQVRHDDHVAVEHVREGRPGIVRDPKVGSGREGLRAARARGRRALREVGWGAARSRELGILQEWADAGRGRDLVLGESLRSGVVRQEPRRKFVQPGIGDGRS